MRFLLANFRRSFRRHDGAPLQERYPNPHFEERGLSPSTSLNTTALSLQVMSVAAVALLGGASLQQNHFHMASAHNSIARFWKMWLKPHLEWICWNSDLAG